MAECLEQASQWHEMYCHDLEVMNSNPAWVELGGQHNSVKVLYLFFYFNQNFISNKMEQKGETKIKMAAFVRHNRQCRTVYPIY